MSEAIKIRIRRLLERAAVGGGSTEGERDHALAAAARLMAEHGLREEELGNRSASGYGHEHSANLAHQKWVARAVSNLYAVHYVFFNYGETTVRFVGRDHNLDAAEFTYGWILDQIDSLYRVALKNHQFTKAERSSFRREFKLACAIRVCNRTFEAANALKGESRALVVHRDSLDAENEQFLGTQPGIKTVPVRAVAFRDSDGTAEGYAAGDQVRLHKEVND